jgi:hypothetical protein
VAQDLVQGLGLNWNEASGGDQRQAVSALLLTKILDQYPAIRNFRDLYDRYLELRDGREVAGRSTRFDRSLFARVPVLEAKLRVLASVDALNPCSKTPAPAVDRAITLTTLADRPAVIWLDLPTDLHRELAWMVAGLAMVLMGKSPTAASAEPNANLKRYAFVDNIAEVVIPAFDSLLRHASHLGIGLILANNAMSDLIEAPHHLLSSLEARVGTRRFFGASDRHQRAFLKDLSGHTVDTRRSWHEGNAGASVTDAETILPRMDLNDLIRISDNPSLSILHMRRGAGYAQFEGFPSVIYAPLSAPKQLHVQRARRPWPAPSPDYPGAYVPDRPTEVSSSASAASPTPTSPQPDSESQAAMRSLIDRQKKARRNEPGAQGRTGKAGRDPRQQD